MPDNGDMLGQEDPIGPAAASAGLWTAFGAAVFLIVVGVFAAISGFQAGYWIILAGVVCAVGIGAAIKFR
ncbi:hypothetical protein KUM39_25280 [Streptomyces sp. J2-1]|uniref:hypothetical protein n=1 Tax=Streptomyces corallincola TaxID=2851888 RepID=UPI001C383E1E|nr:hypothetical protein [Streptomyces corallincola]MBV2357638.1 hypothetical protein [Streptomyces corallincola]